MNLSALRQALPSFPGPRRNSAAKRPDPTLDGFDLAELAPPPVAHLASRALAPTMQAGTRRGQTTTLAPLPPAPETRVYNARAFRRRVGLVQLRRAHAAYKDVRMALLLDAMAPMTANLEEMQRRRMATQAGHALVRLHPRGLMAMGFTDDEALARRVLKGLCNAKILDWFYQVNRGEDREVSKAEIDAAIADIEAPAPSLFARALGRVFPVDAASNGVQLTNRQRWMVHDIILVAKFLYDFGIREGSNAFELELCCGAAAFERDASWWEWGVFLKHLFVPEAPRTHQERLQARLIELSK